MTSFLEVPHVVEEHTEFLRDVIKSRKSRGVDEVLFPVALRGDVTSDTDILDSHAEFSLSHRSTSACVYSRTTSPPLIPLRQKLVHWLGLPNRSLR